MGKFNRADKTLMIAACLFLIALPIKVKYSGNIFASGFLFCIEAALVGGIADWFAVTALFKKPLGIPWHTAILPRRRKNFTDATIRLAQEQFFSKKNIFRRMKSFNVVEKILLWVNTDKNKQFLAEKASAIVKQKLLETDFAPLTEKYVTALQNNTMLINSLDIDKYCTAYLQDNTWKETALQKLSALAYQKLSGDAGAGYIENILDNFEKSKMKPGMSSFWFSLGNIFDVINNKECAELIQGKLLWLIEQASDKSSSIHEDILTAANDAIDNTTNQQIWQDAAAVLKKDILSADILSKIITAYIDSLKAQLQAGSDSALENDLTNIFLSEINNCFDMMLNNPDIKAAVEFFINDIAGRSALQAQSMVGDIVRRAISNMSDAQLNDMVYSKVSTDLIWIRMNGSIVGSGIGLILFIAMTLFA